MGRGQGEREAAPVSMADTATAAAVRGEERGAGWAGGLGSAQRARASFFLK